MIQRFTAQLPEWARSDHPLVRYELGREGTISTRRKYLRAGGAIALVILLYFVGYMIATNMLQDPAGQSLTESVTAVVFWPTLAIQFAMQVGVLMLTVNVVSEQKRRMAWDNLRATESGAGLALRARWAAVFYRMRFFLGIVLVVRVVLIAGILYDLTAFQGRYIDLLINGIIPDISPVVGALLLAFMMTSSLVLPLTSMGFDASLGLLISTLIQQRTYTVMLQLVLVFLRIGVLAALLVGMGQLRNGQLGDLPEAASWGLSAAFGGLGDWGLSFLHLGFFGEIWATIPFAILLGAGLLLFATVQSALTDWILALAIRRAERRG